MHLFKDQLKCVDRGQSYLSSDGWMASEFISPLHKKVNLLYNRLGVRARLAVKANLYDDLPFWGGSQ